MRSEDIFKLLNKISPERFALDWDNSGLLVGNREKEIKTIYIALDATDDVIKEAIQKKADLLITHHPLIFREQKSVTSDTFIGRRIMRLIQNDITYYAMHTNFDISIMAGLAAEQIGLSDIKVLDVFFQESGRDLGMGCIGTFSTSHTILGCCEMIKSEFEIPNVKVFGELHQNVTRVAIVPGSGKNEVEAAIKAKAEVLITGDVDHHTGIDALARGLAVLDAGHYGLEHLFVNFLQQYLKQNCKDISVIAREHIIPFQIV